MAISHVNFLIHVLIPHEYCHMTHSWIQNQLVNMKFILVFVILTLCNVYQVKLTFRHTVNKWTIRYVCPKITISVSGKQWSHRRQTWSIYKWRQTAIWRNSTRNEKSQRQSWQFGRPSSWSKKWNYWKRPTDFQWNTSV